MKTSPMVRLTCSCFLFSFMFFACQKEQTPPPPTEQEQEEFAAISAGSDAEAEAIFSDVFDNVMGANSEVAIGGTGVFNNDAQVNNIRCYALTVTHLNAGSVFPIRIVLDFGTGCVGRDGRTRKGKIITEYSHRLMVAGATATTSFEGYSVRNIIVEGKYTVTNKSTPGNLILEVKVAARLSRSNGDFSEWNSSRIITQIDGQLTHLAFDDAFTVTGSASGSVKKGDKFFQWGTVIIEPLIKKFSCRWIIQGSLAIKKSTNQVAVLDYGSGQCDNKASFKVAGRVREITLH